VKCWKEGPNGTLQDSFGVEEINDWQERYIEDGEPGKVGPIRLKVIGKIDLRAHMSPPLKVSYGTWCDLHDDEVELYSHG
jgi:hypothetical protein